MLGHQFAYSAAPVRKVREVQFGILSPEEIVRNPKNAFLRLLQFFFGCYATIESILCR